MKLSRELGKEVFNRLLEIGVRDIKPEFEKLLSQWMRGRTLLVVTRGPDKCQCCGKLQVCVGFTRKTKRPLEELFK